MRPRGNEMFTRFTLATLASLVGCGPRVECGDGTHEDGGACVADTTTGTGTPVTTSTQVGNNVDLDDFPPVVIRTEPVAGSLGVDVATDHLTVVFNRFMEGGYAWVQVDAALYPDAGGAAWVNPDENLLGDVVLEADHPYLLWLNDPYGVYNAFGDTRGQTALPYPLVFHTGTAPDGLEGLPCAVVGSDPPAGAEDVDPTLDTISVTFSAELDGTSLGWSRMSPKTWPDPVETTFDGATVTATVALVPSATYAIQVNAEPPGFRDRFGTVCTGWLLTFRTADL